MNKPHIKVRRPVHPFSAAAQFLFSDHPLERRADSVGGERNGGGTSLEGRRRRFFRIAEEESTLADHLYRKGRY